MGSIRQQAHCSRGRRHDDLLRLPWIAGPDRIYEVRIRIRPENNNLLHDFGRTTVAPDITRIRLVQARAPITGARKSTHHGPRTRRSASRTRSGLRACRMSEALDLTWTWF